MNNIKPKLFLDMDNTMVDTLAVLNPATEQATTLGLAKPDQIPGIFRNLKPLPHLMEALQQLSVYYDLYILTTAPWNNISAWSDKLAWLHEYFGNDEQSFFYKRVIMTHDKGLARAEGGILVDDRPYHGAAAWEDNELGTAWLQYNYDEKMQWGADDGLVDLLIATAKVYQTQNINIRTALLKANQIRHLKLHGPMDDFQKEAWEK